MSWLSSTAFNTGNLLEKGGEVDTINIIDTIYKGVMKRSQTDYMMQWSNLTKSGLVFNIGLLCGLHTSYISVAVLGFPWL